MPPSSIIIIPTYNEKNNVADVISQVRSAAPGVAMLFVDDNSPDGTAALIQEQSQLDENIHLLKRPAKQGLGPAYVAGFRWALERGYEKLIQMDADLSHPASRLPTILENLDSHELVIGSRYITGGGTKNWGLFRQIISRFGSIYARVITQLPVQDFTGGFNGWRAETLKKIYFETVASKGYAFQIELKARALWSGATFCEVPIVFIDRAVGTSKMSKQIVFEAIYNIAKLRLTKRKLSF